MTELKEEVSRLRRNLAQQLTETGDIVNAIREVDEVLYDGQFFTADEDDEGDFFADIRKARVLLSNLGNDLRHYHSLMEQLAEDDRPPLQGKQAAGRFGVWEGRIIALDERARTPAAEAAPAAGTSEADLAAARSEGAAAADALASERIAELERELAAATAAAADSSDDLRQQVASLTRERDAQADQLTSSKKTSEELQQQLETLRSTQAADSASETKKSDELMQQLAAVTQERDTQQQQLREQVQEHNELKQQVEALQAARAAEQASVAQIEELKRQLAAADNTESQQKLAAELEHIQADRSRITTERDQLQEELAAIKADATQKKSELNILRGKLLSQEKAAAAEVDLSKQELVEKDEKIAGLEAQIAATKAETSTAAFRRKETQAEVERLRVRISELEQSSTEMAQERDDARHEIALVKAGRDEAVRSAASAEKNRAEDQIEALEGQISDLKDSLAEAKSEVRRSSQAAEAASKVPRSDASTVNDLQWQLDNEKTRYTEARKSWERRDGDMRKLLNEAKNAVLKAKSDQDHKDRVAKEVIEGLQHEIAQLKR